MTEGSVLDYLRAMADLDERGVPLSNGAIARAVHVKPPSVTGMLNRLREQRLVKRVSSGEVRLTAAGRRLACRGIRRHRLIETWLIQSLGMDWATAHEEAHQLEHAVSPRLEAALAEYLGHPAHDPHGAVIPDVKGNVKEEKLIPLAELADGEEGVISRLSDRDPEKLKYWSSIGLSLGAHVRRVKVAPFGGPVETVIDGKTAHLGAEALDGAWVRCKEKTR